MSEDWLSHIRWNSDGLLPVIAQDAVNGKVLMMAWMNLESLQRTRATGEAIYWSRSRGRLWHKGESSGHVQRVRGMFLDCDGDTLLIQVEQIGSIACHTGRASCFFNALEQGNWVAIEPVLKTPEEIYGKNR